MPARPLLIAVVGTGWARFLLLFFGLFMVPVALAYARAATGAAAWLATVFAVLYAGGVLTWSARVYFVPVMRTLHRESGWPWIRITFGRALGSIDAFERVVSETKTDDEGKREWVEIRLEGGGQRLVLDSAGGVDSAPARAAAMALVLGLPLEERPGASRRHERPAPSEMRRRVDRALEAEAGTGAVAYACAAILFGNAVTALGVIFAHWGSGPVFALFWLDLCAITFFAILRVAGAESGGWFVAPVGRLAIVLLLLPGAGILLGLAGSLLDVAVDLPAAPAQRLFGFDVPPVFVLAWRGVFEGGAWLALVALVGGHALAYAIDLRRRTMIPLERLGRMLGFAAMRILLTMAVAGIAAAVFGGGRGSPAFAIAILVAARGAFEAWAHVAASAPLWISGDLDLMRAAKEKAA